MGPPPPPPPLFPLFIDVESTRDFTHPLHSNVDTLTVAPMLLLGCTLFAFFCTFVPQVPQVVGQCQAQPAHARLDLPAWARVLAGAGVGAGVGAGAGAGF